MSFNADFKGKKKKIPSIGTLCNKFPNYVRIFLVITQFVGNNCVKNAAAEIII